jgi:aspartate/methionine/tyrosine aminotransferase
MTTVAASPRPPEALTDALRREAKTAPYSGISDVRAYGLGRPGLIPLWVGEGDLPTPPEVCDAATRSLAAGETFYTYQRGLPELRDALARYHEALYGRPFSPERFFIVGGGMQAIQIAARMVAGTGDEVIVPTPAWPNFSAALELGGARAVPVAMELRDRAWRLDIGRLEAAITPRTRALFINSPANPTGWTASRDEMVAFLDLARRRGLWIIADEIYSRFVYDGAKRAPSFHDIMAEDDKILFVQTFSKNWAMTGWRIGWIDASPALGGVIENLIQYSTSGVAVFMQRAAIAALERADGFVEHQIARAKKNRDVLEAGLAGSNRISFARTEGAFYLFLGIDGFASSSVLAKRLIDEANVGLAPGTAFGAAGEGYLRMCFARRTEDIEETVRRLARFLA